MSADGGSNWAALMEVGRVDLVETREVAEVGKMNGHDTTFASVQSCCPSRAAMLRRALLAKWPDRTCRLGTFPPFAPRVAISCDAMLGATHDNPSVKPSLVAQVTVGLIAASLAFVMEVGSADAARQPTFKEREAVTLALPASFRRYPIGCVWLSMSVSNNGRYAMVTPTFLNAARPPCLQYASNGYWLLKKTRSARWRIVFNGSDVPSCSLGVPRDLTKCR